MPYSREEPYTPPHRAYGYGAALPRGAQREPPEGTSDIYPTVPDSVYSASTTQPSTTPLLASLPMQPAWSNSSSATYAEHVPPPRAVGEKQRAYADEHDDDGVPLSALHDSVKTAPVTFPSNNVNTANTTLVSMFRGYGTLHQMLYLSTVLAQSAASLVLILVIWLKIRAGTPAVLKYGNTDDEGQVKRRSITVYLVIFAFGSAFEIVTALDGLRLNNTIQLIGVCLFSLAMVAYAALLDGQIHNAITPVLPNDPWPADLYKSVKPYVIAMPCIQAGAFIALCYFTWLLFKDFGWEVVHLIGADRRIIRMYTKYQIFLTILKFDFFFFVGFSIQYMILVLSTQEVEFIITLIAFPVTIAMLVLAVVAVRREIKWLTWIIFSSEVSGLAYFIFKLYRLFQPSQSFRYQWTKKTLAVFSSLAIAILLTTIISSILCYRNYGYGLKEKIPGYWGEHKSKRRHQIARKNSSAAQGVLDNRESRMSLD